MGTTINAKHNITYSKQIQNAGAIHRFKDIYSRAPSNTQQKEKDIKRVMKMQYTVTSPEK